MKEMFFSSIFYMIEVSIVSTVMHISLMTEVVAFKKADCSDG